MTAGNDVITQQQFEKVREQLGNEICRALELLTSKLNYGFGLSLGRQKQGSLRDFAELREAKSLVSFLKYPDPMETLHADEMAWALKLVRQSLSGSESWAGAVFDKAAQIMGIDLAGHHSIPQDLGRKIGNELQMLDHSPANATLATVN